MEVEKEKSDVTGQMVEEKSRHHERLSLLHKIAARREEDRKVVCLNRQPEVERFHHDADFQKCLKLIRTEDIRCPLPSCRCKIPCQDEDGWRIRAAKPVKKIVSHQLYKSELWLLCRLDSSNSAPEFRKQCQVSKELRQYYFDRIRKAGSSRANSDVWDRHREIKVREGLHNELDAKQRLINDQLIQCEDTKEWAELTKNARQLTNISVSPVRQQKNPGPLGKDTETRKPFYKVERILGVEWYEGEMWYLIKWEGWDLKQSTWETKVEAEECTSQFYRIYGKPFNLKKKILSPEGEEFEKWEKIHKTLQPVSKSKSSSAKVSSRKRKRQVSPDPEIHLDEEKLSIEKVDAPKEIEVITVLDEDDTNASVNILPAQTVDPADLEEEEVICLTMDNLSLLNSPEKKQTKTERKKQHGSNTRKEEEERKSEGKVSKIMGSSRDVNGRMWYLIKWTGADSESWEFEKDIRGTKSRAAIVQFDKENGRPKKKKHRKSVGHEGESIRIHEEKIWTVSKLKHK